MKKSYLLLCLMALAPLLLICNSVLADERNSENDGSEVVEKAAVGAAAATGSLIDAAAAGSAATEIVDQRFQYYKEIGIIQGEVREARSEVTDLKDQVDVTEELSDHPA